MSHDNDVLTIFSPSSQEKLKFSCKNSHIFWETPENLKKGTWCSECDGVKSKSQKDPGPLVKPQYPIVTWDGANLKLLMNDGELKTLDDIGISFHAAAAIVQQMGLSDDLFCECCDDPSNIKN